MRTTSTLARRFLHLLAALPLCSPAYLCAQAPLWAVDLRANADYRAAAANSLQTSRKIVILDDNSVLVLWSFLHKDSSSAFLQLIDANGLPQKSVELGEFPGALMTNAGHDVARLPGNRFLLLLGDELRLGASPELNWIRVQKLSQKGQAIYASPSGRAVILTSLGLATSYLVDPESLHANDIKLPDFFVAAITDNAIAGNALAREGGDVANRFAQLFSFGSLKLKRLCDSCRVGALTSRGKLVLQSNRMWISNSDGQLLYTDPRDLDPTSARFASSSKTDRVAFTHLKITPDQKQYVIDERVAVFDVEQGKDVFSFSLESTRKPNPVRFGFTPYELLLSPDGKRLAVIRDEALRYFALP